MPEVATTTTTSGGPEESSRRPAQDQILVGEVDNEEVVTTMDTDHSHHFNDVMADVGGEENNSIPDINIPEQSQTESCTNSSDSIIISSSSPGATAVIAVDKLAADNPFETLQQDIPSNNPAHIIDNPSETSSNERKRPPSAQSPGADSYVTKRLKTDTPLVVTNPSNNSVKQLHEEHSLPSITTVSSSSSISSCTIATSVTLSSDVCIAQQTQNSTVDEASLAVSSEQQSEAIEVENTTCTNNSSSAQDNTYEQGLGESSSVAEVTQPVCCSPDGVSEKQTDSAQCAESERATGTGGATLDNNSTGPNEERVPVTIELHTGTDVHHGDNMSPLERLDNSQSENLHLEGHAVESLQTEEQVVEESIPAAEQDLESMPAAEQDLESMPAAEQDLESMPAAEEDLESMSAPEHAEESVIVAEHELESIPVPAAVQDLESIPASEQEVESLPMVEQEIESMPASEQELARMPAAAQETDEQQQVSSLVLQRIPMTAPKAVRMAGAVPEPVLGAAAGPLGLMVAGRAAPLPVCLEEGEEMDDGTNDNNVISIPDDGQSSDLETLCTEVVGDSGDRGGGDVFIGNNLPAAVKAEDGADVDVDVAPLALSRQLREQIAAATIPLSIANALPFTLLSSTSTTLPTDSLVLGSDGSLMALPTSSGLVPIRISSSLFKSEQVQQQQLRSQPQQQQQQQYLIDTATGTVTVVPRGTSAHASKTGTASVVASSTTGTTTTTTATTSSTTTSSVMTRILPSLASRPAPRTDILLQTAREVLQLTDDDPPDYRRVFTGGGMEGCTLLITGDRVEEGNILSSASPEDHHHHHQDLSITDEVSHMEVTDESGTYIIEPVSGGEEGYYAEDPNIMWIQETVEVEQESYDNLPNMVIILNPNGTVNEELMLANGMTIETIRAVTDAATGGLNLQTVVPVSSQQQQQQQPATSISNSINSLLPHAPLSIAALQHPIPKKLLTGVQPLTAQAPRTIIESAVPIGSTSIKTEHARSVILDPKDDALVLDDLKDPMMGGTINSSLRHHQQQQQLTSQIISINGTQHIITSSKPLPDLKRLNTHHVETVNSSLHMTPLGTLDLSLPKKPDPSLLEQYVDPNALVSENTVLKVLDDSDFLKRKAQFNKIRRPKTRDENGNGFVVRKTTSLGALGQALHGIPRDSRENAVQICPICKFQATTKNPYRHLQDHLARVHFKDRIAAELPTKKPYICPFEGCDGKQYPDWQAVMRHYIGKKHGILDKYVKEELNLVRRDSGGRIIPGALARPGIELVLQP